MRASGVCEMTHEVGRKLLSSEMCHLFIFFHFLQNGTFPCAHTREGIIEFGKSLTSRALVRPIIRGAKIRKCLVPLSNVMPNGSKDIAKHRYSPDNYR